MCSHQTQTEEPLEAFNCLLVTKKDPFHPMCKLETRIATATRETHGYMDTIQILHTLGIEDTDTHRVKYLGYGYSSPLSI